MGLSNGEHFRTRIQKGYLIGDGAMATLLHQSGQPIRSCFEELNLSDPHLIKGVHSAYLHAGARLIQTNSYSASRVGLARYGLGEQVDAINRASVQIAREAVYEAQLESTDPAFVFGTIGSMIDFIKQTDPKEQEALIENLVEEQASALLEEGVDGLILETYADLQELSLALRKVRRLTDLPIVTNLSPLVIGVTRDGYSIEEAFKQLVELGADVVGLNCRLGLSGLLRTYEQTSLEPGIPYAAVPNGGLLHMEEDGAYAYTANADYFADIGTELVQKGIRLIGGCCGTSPNHIKALKNRLDQTDFTLGDTGIKSQKPLKVIEPLSASASQPAKEDAVFSVNGVKPPTLLEKVKQETTIVVELDPPRMLNVEKYIKGAEALHAAGVDAITLADNSLGTVRVSNMALASLLKARGMEPLVHIACRDRNLIGQQSHLMGLHVLGIHQILLVTGDPSKFGDLPGATSVYDVSSTELIRMVKKLNNGHAFSGQSLKAPSTFVIGTSFNPNVLNFNKAMDRLKRKIEAGADYVMTQPIYDARLFEKLARAVEPLGIPVFVGIMPLTSARNAQFLHHEVPGISLTETILKRMQDAPEESAHEEGIRIAEELVDEAADYFNGIYLVTPFLRYELTVHLTHYLRDRSKRLQIKK
ncbi:bifunctional homocysteine S-methyltransferase/methylenetetrahydrofolate reductase [Pullulanibacillus sp. KACC 23026]|uniref:bifunctional homocysteine S-methyltransferase/methylenetetrahydrofolate reductase n=1 Tax=Pullulanibacillus sp. KACC 23026 TaxID=3028315 RepID=UPI0023AF03A4|nr:bifunctional homocysteine S-methyltransferase/methylenetetrahydrofolate reductase [Pullulanibacillus sp. KACC 23026]WEG14389.1 bifunctional homocysteine S-methyltransferase/methylenetetrahydrofolate reductase [Pullulanibacillus sp. KACC 23026]